MNRETLYDLRALLALYPYYQTARLLMLQNLYLLHDPSFDEELRRTAIYITDRKVIFQMIEAAHYQLKKDPAEQAAEAQAQQAAQQATADGKKVDRTKDLIDSFLGSIPVDANEEEKKKDRKRKPTPADAAVDYVAYLMETEDEQEEEQTSRTISLIDDFIEDGGFKLPKVDANSDYKPEYTPEINNEETEEGGASEETENSGVFTETLARIYIKQGKYERAHGIIDRLYKQHPAKSAYYVDQLRFLEKLMLNETKTKKKVNKK